MNYIAGQSYRIRVPMRDTLNNLVPGLSGIMSVVVIRPNGTPDPAPPIVFAEIAPGVYEFSYLFNAGVGIYTFSISAAGSVGAVVSENVLNNDFDTTVNEIRTLRKGNMQIEFVLASAQILNRNVEVGRIDYEEIKIKADIAVDWLLPLSTKRLYWTYRELGDFDPYRVGPQT